VLLLNKQKLMLQKIQKKSKKKLLSKKILEGFCFERKNIILKKKETGVRGEILFKLFFYSFKTRESVF
jgi:hypothetical protein